MEQVIIVIAAGILLGMAVEAKARIEKKKKKVPIRVKKN
ncbi:MAG: hypothetical protein ACJAT2_000476 [Bacteriovoracaceae bacterium]|jgi:hypothetical protein